MKEMELNSSFMVELTAGVVMGILLAMAAICCCKCRKQPSSREDYIFKGVSVALIDEKRDDSSAALSDSSVETKMPRLSSRRTGNPWLGSFTKSSSVSASGIIKYSYRDMQRATCNFTTLLGRGSYGPVYRAQIPNGATVAVKVVATDSKQGAKEFQTEVTLLGRLHHRNLVNLIGYCAEKNQHMLVYDYMSGGSLDCHLYNEQYETLNWDVRVQIALDVSRGLEYLHDGAVPPVIHRDIKSSNILLDQFMRARVADFGLSREEAISKHVSNIRGTFGYLDPEYISTRTFTKKSDIYSYGMLLFELITGRNPLQGLMELVKLAAMSAEGWEEIVDPRLNGKFNMKELSEVAALAHKCINHTARRRPSMRDVAHVLSRVAKCARKHQHHHSCTRGDDSVIVNMDQMGQQLEHRRAESSDSMLDSFDV